MLLALFVGAALASNVVVDLVDGSTPADLMAEFPELTVEWVDPTNTDEGLVRLTSDHADTLVPALNTNEIVEVAEPIMYFNTLGFVVNSGATNDPDYEKQWHLRAMDSEWVWDHTTSGKNVVVAVLDTGLTVTSDHNPAQMLKGRSFTGEPMTDLNGHGTHCAATIAEWTNNKHGGAGLAKEATILPVKVLSDGGWGQSDWIASGIDWAADNGADEISMSLGGGRSQIILNAIYRAQDKGVVVVAAAGNSSTDGSVGWPARDPRVLSIGATGPHGKRSYFSSWGEGLDIMAPGGDKSFPGGGVFQYTAPGNKEGLYEFQGTSMATPHAAAAVAVLIGEGALEACGKKSENYKCIKQLLVETAEAPPTDAKKGEYGVGSIDLKAAVEKVHKNQNYMGPGESESVVTAGDKGLPYPSPAGNMTLAIGLVVVGVLYAMQRVYNFSPRFAAVTGAVAIASSGPLYFLHLVVPSNLHGLALLMVPWIEAPEYILGPGWSGNPFWLSFLPLAPLAFVMIPFRWSRPVFLGLAVSTFSYLGLNTIFGFNPIWYIPGFGASILLGLSTLITTGFMTAASEVQKLNGDK